MKIFLALLVWYHPVSADTPPDSQKTYWMNELVVTGQRMPVDILHLSSSVQSVDSQMIAAIGGNTVAEALRGVSGVFLRSYGGGGALQSVSIRGMGPDYSLILVDGIRLTTFQIGTVDLGIFSMNDVERIEIASGGNSSAYGADAIGGVVNIITKKPTEGFSLRGGSEMGSFGMTAFSASGNYGVGNVATRASVRRERSKNDFEFLYNDGREQSVLNRNGSDYSLLNTSLTSSISRAGASMQMSVRYDHADRGQPLPMTGTDQHNRARINDDDVMITLHGSMQAASSLLFTVSSSYRDYLQRYNDPAIAVSSHYRNYVSQITPQLEWKISEHHSLLSGIEGISSSIESNELYDARRRQLSVFAVSHHVFPTPFDIHLFPSLRYDTYNDNKGNLSPKLGINIGLMDAPILRIRASYGKNYRIPTFNDLYWIVGGNPDLVPERSNNMDAGIVGAFDYYGIYEIELNYFSIQTKNKIVWQPVSPTVWSPKNLSAVSSSGVEIRLAVSLFDKAVRMQYMHQFTKAVKTSAEFINDGTQNKILPYTPQENSTAVVSATIRNASIAVTHSFVGYRFESQDNDPRFVLSSYMITDVSGSYSIDADPLTIIVKSAIKNLFNTDYIIISGYPTPLRNYSLGLFFIF